MGGVRVPSDGHTSIGKDTRYREPLATTADPKTEIHNWDLSHGTVSVWKKGCENVRLTQNIQPIVAVHLWREREREKTRASPNW